MLSGNNPGKPYLLSLETFEKHGYFDIGRFFRLFFESFSLFWQKRTFVKSTVFLKGAQITGIPGEITLRPGLPPLI